MSGFTGEQVPRGLAFASGNHEPERLVMGWICDREGNDTCLAFTMVTSIPQQAMIPGSFAFGDLTMFAELFLFIYQIIILGPAQNKASPMQKDLGQPGLPAKPRSQMCSTSLPQRSSISAKTAFSSIRFWLCCSPRVVHQHICAKVGLPLRPTTRTFSQ